ncbi:hypothetical protein [Phaeacidiphilus oryzae]|jgi:hypothetical protein|uniref:hypothetical protein n=1 Tax=Phaeacidiphilus oryzae TaxID=348818 RepID=UPI00126A1470|nr:hypothetical protein [Phaeacidiphilus oryzae]
MKQNIGNEPPHEQHNTGPGTFVNGNVEGGIRNLFFLAPGRTRDPGRSQPSGSNHPKEPNEEQDSPGACLGEALFIGMFPASLIAYAFDLFPIQGFSEHPSIVERVACGSLGSFLLLMCSACAFARMTQIFAMWARRAADSAKSNAPNYRLVATANAKTSDVAASLAHISAAIASFIAILFGWFSLGGTVSARAHKASAQATASAAEAWSQVRK